MSPRRIILDTDVASLSIKNALPPVLLRELLGAQVGITFVTLGELSRWAHLRNWGSTKVAGLDAWLSTRPTLPTCLWPPSTSRTSPTSRSTKACGSSDTRIVRPTRA